MKTQQFSDIDNQVTVNFKHDPVPNAITGQWIPHAQAVHLYLFPMKIHFAFL